MNQKWICHNDDVYEIVEILFDDGFAEILAKNSVEVFYSLIHQQHWCAKQKEEIFSK